MQKILIFFRLISEFASHRKGATLALIATGVLCALLELIGITLIVILLQLVGEQGFSIEGEGIAGRFIFYIKNFFGGSNIAVAIAIFSIICFQVALQAFNGMLTTFMGQTLNEDVRKRLHWGLMYVDYSLYLEKSRGELLDLIATQSFTVSAAYNALIRLAVNFLTVFIFISVLAITSIEIATSALVGFFIFSGLVRFISRKGASLAKEKISAGQQMSTIVLRTLQGMRTIRSFSMERHQQFEMEKASKQQTEVLIRQSFVHSMVAPLAEVGAITLLLTIVMLAPLFDISFAVTLTSAALLYRIQPRLREIDWLLIELDNLALSLTEISAYLALELREDPDGVSDVPLAARIDFNGVTVRYPNRRHNVFQALNFSIDADEHVAVIGPSGSGKTTITNLLLRLQDPNEGYVSYGDIPINMISRERWLEKIAIAGQDVELIDGTVRHNLLLANPAAKADEIATAIRLAEIEPIIETLPQGLETWVGDYGQQLSGGQRQRIGIARALLRHPALLVLDEATSAMDEALEWRIICNIREHRKGMAVLLITHNLTVASSFQRVLDIKDLGKS